MGIDDKKKVNVYGIIHPYRYMVTNKLGENNESSIIQSSSTRKSLPSPPSST